METFKLSVVSFKFGWEGYTKVFNDKPIDSFLDNFSYISDYFIHLYVTGLNLVATDVTRWMAFVECSVCICVFVYFGVVFNSTLVN